MKYFYAKIYENSNKKFLIYAWLPLEVEIFNYAKDWKYAGVCQLCTVLFLIYTKFFTRFRS